jgi:DNA invertase Pin-like site-specific DNA recombinase
MTNHKLTPERLGRRAIVYVRQSTPGQVINNLESQRRQYNLADRARELGFHDVRTIDDDLGRSGGGQVERPGFQQLVTEVCAGHVGAIFCIEASRLARNGRDWHHLIELCGLVGAVIVDPDGVYDPCLMNDRLLLGLKGTMSEFELNLFRQRSMEAIRMKASRGELRFCLPVGLCWSHNGKVEIDPDQRVQEAIHLAFCKLDELGSVRQVVLWFIEERLSFPSAVRDEFGQKTVWKPPVYNAIYAVIRNPMYAGAYGFGKTEIRTRVEDGRARKSHGHRKPLQGWTVLIKDHHPGYITWEQFERNQQRMVENAHMKPGNPKAGRGGQALLSGLIRCARCACILHVWYKARKNTTRYYCFGNIAQGGNRCIGFGGLKAEQVVTAEILRAIAGDAVEAAIQAAEQVVTQRKERQRMVEMELEQARYEALLASRRYESIDPENRLVARELEARWNLALQKAAEVENRLNQLDRIPEDKPLPDKNLLMSLAHDLPAVWDAPNTDMRLKQRIVRILIREIVADIDQETREVVLLIHWWGGRHTELRFPKNPPGMHGHRTSMEAVDVVRRMAGLFPDKEIAATLNRLRIRTGHGNAWTPMRVATMRCYHKLPAYTSNQPKPDSLTLEQVAEKLGICTTTTRKLLDIGVIEGTQVIPCAPWQIFPAALETDAVKRAINQIRRGKPLPALHSDSNQQSFFSTT